MSVRLSAGPASSCAVAALPGSVVRSGDIITDDGEEVNENTGRRRGTPEQIFEHPKSGRTKGFIYRVRSWEYSVAADVDFYEMMASLENFCRLQFMGEKASNDCQLALEELVTGYLMPVLKKYPGQSVVIRIDAGEQEKGFSLTVDTRGLPQNEFLTTKHDAMAEILLRNLLKPMPDKEPGVFVFARQ